MKIARTIEEVRTAVRRARVDGKMIGFIPTMGFLHEGHLSLVDLARAKESAFVVVSIFVNPTQFGPGEDYDKYPRDVNRDEQLLREREVDLLFLPDVDTVYPDGFDTYVAVGSVGDRLEGEFRPDHFSGVGTVVLKLFNIVQPDFAVFGQKDAQQCVIVEHLVRDLDLPVEIVVAPTSREEDGLARSSRNSYLSADERRAATVLFRALQAGARAIEDGATDPDQIEHCMRAVVDAEPSASADYLRLVDARTFQKPADLDRNLILVGAVRIGRTRLIDNIPLTRVIRQEPVAQPEPDPQTSMSG